MMNELAQYPVIHEQAVAWGDMDAFGHVNNVLYYRYIESARIRYLDALNIFDKVSQEPSLRLDMMLEPGDIQFCNNYCVMHSRSSFEDYEDLSPEEKLEIEKELYREKQIEAGVAPEDISDELPDEILEQSGIAPDQTAGEQNSQESAGQGDGTTSQQTSQSQGMPAFSDDMLRMISQEVVQENAEMILAEDANADLGLINETIFENLKNLMSQTGGAVTQEDMESLLGEVISRNFSGVEFFEP